MNENNPWLNIPYGDYERHMMHPDVAQLQQLNTIIGDKVKQFAPATVAVLGACTGNGFEHFKDVEKIYAIDVNAYYLEICKQRFGQYGDSLQCMVADIDRDELRIPAGSIDLVVCQLILEYVNVKTALDIIHRLLSLDGILNIVIQENGDNSFVSNTGVSSLAPLSTFAIPVKEDDLLKHQDFRLVSRTEYRLPNGKVFKSIDLEKA